MQGDKPLANKSVAIMVASGFTEAHMTDVQKALISEGAQTTIVSPEIGVANGWHDGGWGHNFFVDERISDVLPSQFDLLLAPGGERSTATLAGNAHVRRVLKGMMEAGKPVALTDDAVGLLADAEVAKDRKVAAPETATAKLTESGAVVEAGPVVTDGALVTMSGDETISTFVTAVLASLGVEADADAEEAAA